MRLFDLHCDTITELAKSGECLAKNNGHISLDRAGYLTEYVQDYAIFIPDEYRGKAAVDYFDSVYTYYKKQIAENGISEYGEKKNTAGIFTVLQNFACSKFMDDPKCIEIQYKD